MKKDPKYIGIPNINFSLTSKEDKREKKFKKQRKKRGFDDSETWALDSTICNFIIPRLKRYIKVANKRIIRDPKRIKDTNKFLLALELILKEYEEELTTKEEKQIEKGLKVFPDIFRWMGW